MKLEDFYDNCLAPEIVSPVHIIGLKGTRFTVNVKTALFGMI